METWLEFNFHDRAAMRVSRAAPTAPQLEDIFEGFLDSGLKNHDLTVVGEYEQLVQPSHSEHELRFTDDSLLIASTGVQVTRRDGRFEVRGTRELLTSVLPLVDCLMTAKGAPMIHAATIDLGGRGIFLPAAGGVGKTSTVAKLMRHSGAGFLGDDWGFLSSDGDLLGFPKPMFVKPHHRPIYPHLFQAKRKPLIPKKFSKSIGKMTTLVHPFVTKYPRVAGVTRRWSPEHIMVTPQEAFPGMRMATSAPLTLAIFVERYDGDVALLEERSSSWMASRALGNFHAELASHSRDLLTALATSGVMPIERFFAEKSEILNKALFEKPNFLLRVPGKFSADHASDVIVEHVFHALELVGE